MTDNPEGNGPTTDTKPTEETSSEPVATPKVELEVTEVPQDDLILENYATSLKSEIKQNYPERLDKLPIRDRIQAMELIKESLALHKPPKHTAPPKPIPVGGSAEPRISKYVSKQDVINCIGRDARDLAKQIGGN